MDPNIQSILEDIFELDPTLKSQEAQIMGIIEKMTEMKPNTKFDKKFQSDLHDRIKHELAALPVKKSIRERISGVISYFQFSRRYSYVSLAGLLVVIGLGGFWLYGDLNTVPTVIGGNVSLEYRKIPYNVESLDIQFSTSLDKETVTTKNITLSPYVEGQVSLIDESTIRYKLAKPLTIDENYILTVSKEVTSSHGVKLNDDFVYNFKAIGGAKATKVLPSGETENLSQNITVLFNIPVVPLATLSTRDKLPCPITITPKLDGVCKWTSPTILEYIPKTSLAGATEYKVTISDVPGLQYKLMESLESTFVTEKLTLTIGTPNTLFDADNNAISDTNNSSFMASDGLEIRSNFAIDEKELAAKMVFKNDKQEITPFQLKPVMEKGIRSESRYILTLKGKPFSYSTSYSIEVANALKPKYGNVPTVAPRTVMLRSSDFFNYIGAFRRVFSATGALIDTKDIGQVSNGQLESTQDIPRSHVFFQASFAEEVPADSKYFSIVSDKGEKIPFDVHYVKKEEYLDNGELSGKIVDDKQVVEVAPTKDLEPKTKYKIIVDKTINANLVENAVATFTTAPALEIKDFAYVSNTEMCVYLTNDLYDWGYPNTPEEGKKNLDAISFSPKALVRGLNKYVNYDSSAPQICPQKDGLVAYFLNARLDAKTKYTLTINTGLTDKYGSTLIKGMTREIVSGDLKETDKYLYSSLSKDVNVIPDNLPIVMNLQSINLNSAVVEVCEMGIAEYQDYVSHMYEQAFQPKCVKLSKKTMPLKNKNWYLSPNKFDVEKDIIGGKMSQQFILVRGSTQDNFEMADGYRDAEREFQNVFIRSNLSLTLEKGANKQLIFASSFDGKIMPSDLTFDVYTSEGYGYLPVKVNIKWNKEKGAYELPGDARIDMLVAKNAKYFGLLEMNMDQTSNYDFHYISGQDTMMKDYLYIYPDRPLYKPGETVYFKGLLRNFSFDGYKKSPVTTGKLKIADENGTAISELTVTLDKNSNFSSQFILPKEVALGRFHFEFYAGTDATPVYNDGHFYIEEYKKPTFKVNLSVDKSDVMLGGTAKVVVNPEYYFGGKVVNTEYTWSAVAQKYFFDSKEYADYQFGEGYAYYDCLYWGFCDYSDELKTVKDDRIDANGKSEFEYAFPTEAIDKDERQQSEKIYNFNVTVTDPDTKKTVSKTTSSVLHTTDGYVGLQVPYWVSKASPVTIRGVVLDYSAKPMSGKSVTIEVVKQEWKNIKKQGVDGIFYNDYSLEKTKEDSFSVSSGGNGEWAKEITPKTDGEYEIRALYTGANGKTFISTRTIYVSGESYIEWNNGNNTTTDLTSEKSMLKVGETASFTLKSPVKSGKMFVTVEKDDGILDYFTQDITSYGQKIELPIRAEYYPNVYIKAFVLGAEEKNPLPIFKRAMSVIKVVTDFKKLSVAILPGKTSYLPGEKISLSIQVKDSDGKAVKNANGSVAVVDESLLALKGNPKKNPFAFFYEMKRYLGVETYISLNRLIEKLEVKDAGNGEKGGAGEGGKGGLSKKKRGIFKDTAYWLANFTTDANGVAKIVTDALPDNLTTWDIESVVSTSDNRIGVGEVTVMTNKQVMIDDNLPRFFGVGDMITLSPVVFNKTGKDGFFTIDVKAKNATISESNREVFIKQGEQATVPFVVQVTRLFANDEEKDRVQISFKASLRGTDIGDEIEKVLPLKPTSISETVAIMGKTNDVSVDEHINISNLSEKTGEVTVRYGATLLSNLLSGMEYLSAFPYGCSEQQTSAVLPNLIMKRLYQSAGQPFDLTKKMVKYWSTADAEYKQKSVDDIIKDYLVDIKKFQKNDGGFAYWHDIPYKTYSDFSLSSYVLSTVSESRAVGYFIDKTAFAKTSIYLKNRFYIGKYEDCSPSKENRYCAYPESLRAGAVGAIIAYDSQDYEAYKMYKLLKFQTNNEDRIAELSLLGKLLSVPALKSNEKAELLSRAKLLADLILSKEVVVNPRGAFIGKSGGASRLELTSGFVEAISNVGLSNFADISTVIDGMNRWIISEKKDGYFGSTAGTAQVIRSLTTYLEKTGELKKVSMKAKIVMNSDVLAETTIDLKNALQPLSVRKQLEGLGKDNIFHTEKQGQGTLYYDVQLRYMVPAAEMTARDEGFFIASEYFDYNEFKKITALKDAEYEAYLTGGVDYEDLKYPKGVYEYLTPVVSGKVGQLLLVHNKVITAEARDKVAFEGFVPAGTELVNVNLSTENQSLRTNSIFDREEFRDDRYFGYTASLDAGIYGFDYILRLTHDGLYGVKPARIFEFYNEEVFGRTGGRIMKIEE